MQEFFLSETPAGGQARDGARAFRLEVPDGARIQDLVVGFLPEGLASLELHFEGGDAGGTGSTGRPFPASGVTQNIVFEPQEVIIGISGLVRRDADEALTGISTLFVHTNQRTLALPDPSAPRTNIGVSFQLAEIAQGARFIGFHGTFGDAAGNSGVHPGPATALIRTLGIILAEDPPVDLGEDLLLRWRDRDAQPPHQDPRFAIETGELFGSRQNPNFTNTPVFRVEQADGHLRIFHTSGRVDEYFYAGPADRPFRSLYRSQTTSELIEVQAGIGSFPSQIDLGSTTLEPFDVLPPADNPLKFGETFNLPERPGFDEVLYNGWDVTAIDPRDLQVVNPQRFKVFDYPDQSSKNYSVAEFGRKVFVPHGVIFITDGISVQHGRSVSVTTGEEHSKTWSTTLGVNLGFLENVTFSSNEEYKNSVEEGLKQAGGYTISTGYFQDHHMVLDEVRVQLDSRFVRRVNELANDIESGRKPDYTAFINAFGTHYAHAATFGGRTYQELRFSRKAVSEANSTGVSITTSASVKFKAKLGVETGSSSESRSAADREAESQRDSFVSVGGEPSLGSFTLGNKAVPVLVDLRPLHTLLNPVFFTREIISKRVGPELEAANRERAKGFPPFNPRLGAPAVFEVELKQLIPASAGTRFTGSIIISIPGRADSPSQPVLTDLLDEVAGTPEESFPPPTSKPGEQSRFLFMFLSDSNPVDLVQAILNRKLRRRWTIADGASRTDFVRIFLDLREIAADGTLLSASSNNINIPLADFQAGRKEKTFPLELSGFFSNPPKHQLKVSFGNSGSDPLFRD